MEPKEITKKETWEEFVKEHPEANFLHSWYWGEFHEMIGNRIFRVGFYDNDKLYGVMLAILEKAKRGRYLVVPGGPIMDWSNKELLDSFLEELKKLCKDWGCSFARVRPQLEESEESLKLFENLGFKRAPMYLHAELTSQLDITAPEADILSGMRKTTRYEIKKANNLGIKVSDDFNKKNSQTFLKLQEETAKRQGFVPFSDKFLLNQFEFFIKNSLAKLYTATFNHQILAQSFIIFYGREAVYHYGASSIEGRKYPGAYLIQWEAILEAKRRGLNRYNFWGVAPEGTSDHRFSGLSLFKRGFGGRDFKYLPAHDLVVNKHKYLLNYFVEKLRRKLRRA
jgi:lipid II:glycine glycyltransferase (peptidoglycan interpeptide bridge formation enzyme)